MIGCPGSGKSTFARALAKKTNLPLVHMDMLYWNPDRTTVDKAVFHARLCEAMKQEKWIIDGNYGATMDLRMANCDTVFFLDYDTQTCLEGIAQRRGKPRSDMPWVEDQTEDEDFIEFIRQYSAVSRPKVLELLQAYSKKNIHIFKDRSDAERFLSVL